MLHRIPISPLALVVLAAVPAAQDLVADPTPGSGFPQPGSSPNQIVDTGAGWAALVATDRSGTELWRTDGTSAGTWQLGDLAPGTQSSNPRFLTPDGRGGVVAAARIPGAGEELVHSDGTSGNTGLLLDILPGRGGSEPREFTRAHGVVYFSAFDPQAGRELWRTDGTPAGTVRAADVFAGVNSSDPSFLTEAGGDLWFFAYEPSTGNELRRLDANGTLSTFEFVNGPAGGRPRDLVDLGNGKLFLFAQEAQLGEEPYAFDRVQGTYTNLRDVLSGPTGSGGQSPVASNGLVFFSAIDSATAPRNELWATDGTRAGTRKLPLTGASATARIEVRAITPLTGGVVFAADDGVHGYEPWYSDGVTTRLLADLTPGPTLSGMDHFASIGSRVVFTGTVGGVGTEPFVASPAGVRRLVVGSFGPYCSGYASFGARVLFAAESPVLQQGIELFVADVNARTAAPVADLHLGSLDSDPADRTPYGNGLAFVYQHGPAFDLFTTEVGSPAPVQVTAGEGPGEPVEFAGDLWYSANVAFVGRRLFRWNGTASTQVGRVGPPSKMTPAQTWMAFVVGDQQLWSVDAAGNVQRIGSQTFGFIRDLAPVGPRLFFSAIDQGVERLYVTDGPGTGIARVDQAFGGPDARVPRELTVSGGRLFYSARDAASGRELYVVAGNAVTVLDVPVPGAASADPVEITAAAGGRAFFMAVGASGLRELWGSDGTVAGTRLVHPLQGRLVEGMAAVDDEVVFLFDDGTHGREPWLTDWAGGSARMLVDLAPGGAHGALPDSARPLSSTEATFVGAARSSGLQLFRTDGTVVRLASAFGELNRVGAVEIDPDVVSTPSGLYLAAVMPRTGRELWLIPRGARRASATLVASGCASPPPQPVIGAVGLPRIGTTFAISLAHPPSAGNAAVLNVSLAPASVQLLRTGCSIVTGLITLPFGTVSLDAAGSGRLSVPVPNDPRLNGLVVGSQWIALQQRGPALGVANLSQELRLQFGL